jgi:hypothetical protein
MQRFFVYFWEYVYNITQRDNDIQYIRSDCTQTENILKNTIRICINDITLKLSLRSRHSQSLLNKLENKNKVS